MKKIAPCAMAFVLLIGMSAGAQARYYDPGMGRFISANSKVKSPHDPQTLNRYTYVRNNPIIYSDPDGHFFFVPILIGIAIGGSIAGTHGHPFTPHSWNNFDWHAATIGAVAGAAGGAAGAWAAAALAPSLGGFGVAGSIAIGADAGAFAGAASYSASTVLTGSPWSWKGFGLSVVGGAAFGGAVGGLTSPHLLPFLRGSESFTGVPTSGQSAATLTVSPDVSPPPELSGPEPESNAPRCGIDIGACHLRMPETFEPQAASPAGEPINLREQLARDWATSNPEAGYQLPLRLEDSRWPASQGWMKYQQIYDPKGEPITIHYNYNYSSGQIGDPKIVR